MTSPSEYYEKSLYPLQNGVLRIVERCNTRFFLTGGTALSRGYYQHRYSDDLDFFMSSDKSFIEQTNLVLNSLKQDGFNLLTAREIRNNDFVSIFVTQQNSLAELKLDFVNDSVPHFGGFVETPLFNRTDCIQNILSNKLGAVYRFAAKDVADIREIALHENIDWQKAFNEAQEKVGGVEPYYVAEILQGIPRSEYETIQWVNEPGWETFKADIDRMVESMIRVS